MDFLKSFFTFCFGSETACLVTGAATGLILGFSWGFWLSGNLGKAILKFKRYRILKDHCHSEDYLIPREKDRHERYCPECFRNEGKLVLIEPFKSVCRECGYKPENHEIIVKQERRPRFLP